MYFKQKFFQNALTKNYNENNLKDYIKGLYSEAGSKGQSITFILTDAKIKSENFLEYIKSFLSNGKIADLITKYEKDVFVLRV